MSFSKNETKDVLCTDDKIFLLPVWIHGVKILLALLIIAENLIVFLAIIRNWKTLMRQHNLYRYVMSLVVADLLNGTILLFHGMFWIVLFAMDPGLNDEINLSKTIENHFEHENPSEVIRNLIIGVVHGLTFASLASSALLNLVLRVTSTKALARAAGIRSRSGSCMKGISWVRSPRITIGLIGAIWVVTLVFVVFPLIQHCETGYQQCIDPDTQMCFIIRNETRINDTDDCDCSVLRMPTKRSYLFTLNGFLTMAWILLLFCICYTTCVKSRIERTKNYVEGKTNLKLVHSFGITLDSSSFFALIITVNMTLSSLPFIVFTYITETGSPSNRVFYGAYMSKIVAELVELTTYLSSVVNPFIYTAMLTRLRSDVSRLLERHKGQKKTNLKKKNNSNFTKMQV